MTVSILEAAIQTLNIGVGWQDESFFPANKKEVVAYK